VSGTIGMTSCHGALKKEFGLGRRARARPAPPGYRGVNRHGALQFCVLRHNGPLNLFLHLGPGRPGGQLGDPYGSAAAVTVART